MQLVAHALPLLLAGGYAWLAAMHDCKALSVLHLSRDSGAKREGTKGQHVTCRLMAKKPATQSAWPEKAWHPLGRGLLSCGYVCRLYIKEDLEHGAIALAVLDQSVDGL